MKRSLRFAPFLAALLLALALAPAAGATVGGGRPAPPKRRLRADAAQTTLATTIVQALGAGAVGKVGAMGLGWVLQAFGASGEMSAAELQAVRGELTEIKDLLKQTQEATTAIRAELAEGVYSQLTGEAIKITAGITEGMNRLDEVANMSPDNPTKASFTAETLEFIHQKLMGSEQQELNDRINGVAGGEGLIVAASKVEKTASPYWTVATSAEVRKVFDYYQAEEARLLLLRVEYMHSEPGKYDAERITAAIEHVREQLREQDKLLKPAPPADTIALTSSNALFDFSTIGGKYKFPEAAKRIAEGSCGDTCWRVAGGPTIAPLIAGWTGASWNGWLNQQTGGAIPSLAALGSGFEGVWTEAKCPFGNRYKEARDFVNWCAGSFLKPGGVDEIINVYSGRSGPESLENGYILVKGRPESYWW